MKVNFFTAYGLMWKRIVDFKGTSGLKEFWFPFIWQTVITLLTIPFIVMLYLSRFFSIKSLTAVALIPLIVLFFYLNVTILPFASLTIRRLRDAGKSGWWYLLILAAGVGTIWLLVLCSSGSVLFQPNQNEPAAIYGPPPIEPYGVEFDDSGFDPSRNEPMEIYGPPAMLDEDLDEEESFEIPENENVCIYGPPEMFENRVEP